ncbi:MAG TPA: alpha-L-fucosidase [Candidatus Acidoferrales bacterium]|nr:alpha-L-fucosidase [Candidatus Acidoferrales bacterium]
MNVITSHAKRAKFIRNLVLATVLAAGLHSFAADHPVPAIQDTETKAQRDARMAWWRQARFGMFIHWGLYAVPAGTWQGKPVGGIGEWIMHNAQIPVADYQRLTQEFNPTKFNAEEWVGIAKAAGMKYIVITAKHHDGFAMFKSKANPFNIVDATPFKRDPLKELAAACRKQGIKLGFYYSQDQDWTAPGGAAFGGHWDKAQDGDFATYLKTKAIPQLEELLTNYQPFPAVIWFDTPTSDMTPQLASQIVTLLNRQPRLIWNNRLGGGFAGDTETPEQQIPPQGYPGKDWETCMTINDTWGYKSDDHNFKSTATLLHNLVDIASKGGNYLLNVGPDATGTIPPPEVERLKEIGAWLNVNGEAIYGTTASPFKNLPWGRCTKRIAGHGTTLFLHVFNWPADGKLMVPGLKNTVTAARVLATGDKLTFSQAEEGVVVDVPAVAPDPISATLVLQIHGTPEVAQTFLRQAPDGSIHLPASEADLHGALQYEMGGGKDNIGFWTDPADTADWTFKVDRPGHFKLTADIAALESGSFQIILGGQKLEATAPATGDYTRFQTVPVGGMLEIAQAGVVTLLVKPVAAGWQPMNLRSLRLMPATP